MMTNASFALPARASRLLRALCACALLIGQPATAADAGGAIPTGKEHQVITADGTDLSLQRFVADGDFVLLWLAPGYGKDDRSPQLAQQLAQRNIEVWLIDLAQALFQPQSAEQMRSVNSDYVADLITSAHAETGKRVLVSAAGYGAIPLLGGIHAWQARQQQQAYLIGGLLFSPDLYITVPALGLPPEYVPVTGATNLPLAIFQDAQRGNRWHLDSLLSTLRRGGSTPQVNILTGVSALLHVNDTAAETLRAVADLPDRIKALADSMARAPAPLTAAPLPAEFRPQGSGIDDRLKKFKGKFLPLPIDLKDSAGHAYKRRDYAGQITLVNFWATWCSPCLQEIPSLNRLKAAMQGTPFELISINYAEKPATIRDFLRRVNLDFPVLLDTDGKFAAAWQVLAFPSTYVIGPDGRIQFGVNAAIEWDTPEVINTLRALAATPRP